MMSVDNGSVCYTTLCRLVLDVKVVNGVQARYT